MNISGDRSHQIVEYAKQILLNLQHRGAAGADESSAAAEESRAAINQIEKAADTANGKAEVSLRRVNESQALAKTTSVPGVENSPGVAL